MSVDEGWQHGPSVATHLGSRRPGPCLLSTSSHKDMLSPTLTNLLLKQHGATGDHSPSILSGAAEPTPLGGRCRFPEWLRLGGVTPYDVY